MTNSTLYRLNSVAKKITNKGILKGVDLGNYGYGRRWKQLY